MAFKDRARYRPSHQGSLHGRLGKPKRWDRKVPTPGGRFYASLQDKSVQGNMINKTIQFFGNAKALISLIVVLVSSVGLGLYGIAAVIGAGIVLRDFAEDFGLAREWGTLIAVYFPLYILWLIGKRSPK